MSERKFVVAGSYKQAKMWADSRGLGPHEWAYVDRAVRVWGTRGAHFVWTGTWSERDDIPQLSDAIANAGGVITHEPTLLAPKDMIAAGAPNENADKED